MSWVCIPFTCSRGSEAESCPTSERDTLQSVLSNSKAIPEEFYSSDNLMEFYQSFPFGTVSHRFAKTILTLPTSFGEQSPSEIDLSSKVDSLARTFPVPEKAKASRAKRAGSGKNKRESYAKFDRDLSGWRTHQRSLLGGWIEFSETWPKWGTMRGGELYPLRMPSGLEELRQSITNAKECGLLVSVPTPNCEGYRSDGELRILARLFDEDELRLMAPRAAESKIIKALETQRIGTVTATNKIRSEEFAEFRTISPREFTERMPTLHGFSKDGKSNGPSGNELGRAVNESIRRLPTLTKGDSNKWNNMTEQERIDKGQFVRLGNVITDIEGNPAGGSMNPEWTEWLMGFPIGWSSLEPMTMQQMQEWFDNPHWWMNEPEGIPRVAKGVKHCSRRIAGLGNAQVPECAAMAWEILFNELAKP